MDLFDARRNRVNDAMSGCQLAYALGVTAGVRAMTDLLWGPVSLSNETPLSTEGTLSRSWRTAAVIEGPVQS